MVFFGTAANGSVGLFVRRFDPSGRDGMGVSDDWRTNWLSNHKKGWYYA